MSQRETLRAISQAVLYLEQDAKQAGADSLAMYLRLASMEADNLLTNLDARPSGAGTAGSGPGRRRSASAE
jgi:hypothetical protein